jgi:ATP-dependent RNA helicase RhlE
VIVLVTAAVLGHPTLTDFTSLGLSPALLAALAEEGYTAPTPIQSKAIPPLLLGRDLLGIAQTGTGKTAAFALPILHRLAATPRRPQPKTCRALILSPTRELASQIADSFRAYGRHMKLSVAVVFGGVGHRPQIQALARGLDVLVATPGRLLDHMGEGFARLGDTEIFVLDEADQMLDLGFVKPIRQIVARLPRDRQNLFFSATMPKEIAGLAGELLRDPVRVEVTPVATTAERVSQRVIHVEQSKKAALLAEVLGAPAVTRALVFTRTKRGADRVARSLDLAGFGCAAIHGNKSQSQRERALEAFRGGDITILVATDIAARGIDVDGVSHVVNYDLPEVPEAYVHRIGRTARAGASGEAIAFCDGGERDLLRQIERLTRQQIPSEDRRRDEGLTSEVRTPRPQRDDRTSQGRSRVEGHRGNGRRGEREAGPDAHTPRSNDRSRPNGARHAGQPSGEYRSERGPVRGQVWGAAGHRSRDQRRADDTGRRAAPREGHRSDAGMGDTRHHEHGRHEQRPFVDRGGHAPRPAGRPSERGPSSFRNDDRRPASRGRHPGTSR